MNERLKSYSSKKAQNTRVNVRARAQLLGRLILDFGDTKKVLGIFRKTFDSLKGIRPPSFLVQNKPECRTLVQYIYERNREIANWKPPEEEVGSNFFKSRRPVYKKWEVDSSKKVVELFDQIQAHTK